MPHPSLTIRHSLHLGPLRHAAICALDLGHNSSALDDNILLVEVKLKVNYKDLPQKRGYEPIVGFTLIMKMTREMLGRIHLIGISCEISYLYLHQRIWVVIPFWILSKQPMNI